MIHSMRKNIPIYSRDIPKKFSYTLSNTMNKYNGHIYISPRYANSIYKLDSCYLKEYIHVRLKDSIDSKTLKTITDEKFEDPATNPLLS